MRITKLVLNNFRNYPDLNLNISGDVVILTGPNAVGKTNLIEAIYFTSLFKSFRNDAEFVFLRGSNNASLTLETENAGQTYILDVFLEQRERIYANFKLNGVKKGRKEVQGFLRVVVFEPSDVEIFSRSPEFRRRYLNMVLSQFNPAYMDSLNNFKRVLTQKQKLLSGFAESGKGIEKDLDAWNEQLINYGAEIILARRQFINFINQHLAEVYSGISNFHKPVEINYDSIQGEDREAIRANFANILAEKKEKELLSGQALVGPHRDDFRIHSEGVLLAPFSSRGELRSQILAMKLLELEYLSRGEDKPVLLLDDVLSELDDTRRTYLLKYLQGRFQTFITTTHPLELAAQHITLTPSQEEA